MMVKISASILSADFACLADDCRRALDAGADWLHIDVMDGHFVPNISYGAPVLSCLHKALPQAYYDVHLMISDPAGYAADFARAGADSITFHLEAVPGKVEETIRAIHDTGCKAGISIRPGTPVEEVYPYLALVDLVLVMSVEPGFGGQSFLPASPERLAALKAECLRRGVSPVLQVDGGVNGVTAPLCVQAGADNLVAGSSLFRAADLSAAVCAMRG